MSRRPFSAFASLALPAILLVACASPAAPTPQPSVRPPSPSGKPTPTPSGPVTSPRPVPSSPAPSGDPSPIPSPSPTPKPTKPPEIPAGGFLTPAPTGFRTTWQAISWQQLDPKDPFVRIRQMLRWQGGYVAVAEPDVDTETSSHSPLFISDDGVVWRPLPADTLGQHAAVVRVVESRDGLVAITLTGGHRDCEGPEGLACWSPSGPLKAWTSADGEQWAPGPVADIKIGTIDGVISVPFVAARDGVVVVMARDGDGYRVVTSQNGVAWKEGSIASAFTVNDMDAFDNGFVAVGQFRRADGSQRAVAYFSVDGTVWTRASMPVPNGVSADFLAIEDLVAGPSGLIATGHTMETPGAELWWGSVDGSVWSVLDDYPPLGAWHGEGEGDGLYGNGTLVSDGERFIAYRVQGGVEAWTSKDGAAWSPLQVVGSMPSTSADPDLPWLVVLPVGVMVVGGDHDGGIGVPSA